MDKKIAIISTHPIQYNAPLYRRIAKEPGWDLLVFYTWSQSQSSSIYDPGFKQIREWDIPLLTEYNYCFVENTAKKPGTHHFWGIINPELGNKIQKFNPDIVIIYGWSFWSHLKFIIKNYKKYKIVFRGDSTNLDLKKLSFFKSKLRKVFLSFIYKKIYYFLYVGKKNKEYYLFHNVPSNKLIFAPHSVDNDRFLTFDTDSKIILNTLQKDLGINEQDLVFLFAGKLELKKNPQILINAFLKLNDPNSHLVILGSGELEFELKKLSEGQKNIHFLGFQNQSKIPLLYRIADVFVLPSQGPYETWGLCMNEAMACGLPVIGSSKCGGSFDLIINKYNGWVFESENLDDLISILKECKKIGKSGLKTLGENSRFHIQKFSYDIFISALKQIV
jgi:glycosyltransferase involved in cell wall biosynthesis